MKKLIILFLFTASLFAQDFGLIEKPSKWIDDGTSLTPRHSRSLKLLGEYLGYDGLGGLYFDESDNAFFTHNVGTAGNYSTIFGSGNLNAETDADKDFVFYSGYQNAYSATGNVFYSTMSGYQNAYSATGSVYYSTMSGDRNAYSATGNVYYSTMSGYRNAYSATGSVSYSTMSGYQNAYSATGSVYYSTMSGGGNAYSATGDVSYSTMSGDRNAYSATGNVYYSTMSGYRNAYKTSDNTLNYIIAMPYQALDSTTATELDYSIALGYRAGYKTSYNSPAIFGYNGQPTANNQVVIGSEFYTGGILLDTFVIVNGIIGHSAQGTSTLGVGATTFAVSSNVMTITGDGGGNTIATITGASVGTYTFIFVDGNVTITDTDAHTSNTVDLAGTATDFTSADDKTLQLVYDGTSWYEISRSTN